MVTIKEMKIPKNCTVCPLCERMGSHLHCPVAKSHIDIRYTEGRHPDCPLVEIEERKVGKWKRKIVDDGFNADWICTECGYKVMDDFVHFNYCPNCGAEMGGNENG